VTAPAKPPAAPKRWDQDIQNRVECHQMEETGTRLGGSKVCKTHAQWAEEALMAREATERYQSGGAAKAGK
jgi:hypothetical protein